MGAVADTLSSHCACPGHRCPHESARIPSTLKQQQRACVEGFAFKRCKLIEIGMKWLWLTWWCFAMLSLFDKWNALHRMFFEQDVAVALAALFGKACLDFDMS
jgi:hypothetical protein